MLQLHFVTRPFNLSYTITYKHPRTHTHTHAHHIHIHKHTNTKCVQKNLFTFKNNIYIKTIFRILQFFFKFSIYIYCILIIDNDKD